MTHRFAADVVALFHFGFVIFVALGALLALRWPRVLWAQVPAALWGIWIEFSGGICPLTPLENSLRMRGGEAGYHGGFVEHYIVPVLYPPALTRNTQFILGIIVIAI